MSPRARIAAVVLAAAVIAAAVAAPTERRPGHAGSPARLPAVSTSPHTPAHAAGRAPAGGRHKARVAAARERRAALAVATEFVAAFLVYERGAHRRAVIAALARTAAPPFARALRAAPARRPPGRRWPAHARVREITLIGPAGNRAKALAALVRAGRREVLELRLRRDTGGWHVAGLG